MAGTLCVAILGLASAATAQMDKAIGETLPPSPAPEPAPPPLALPPSRQPPEAEFTCGQTVNGTTTGSGGTRGNDAPDHLYSFTVETAGIVQFDSCDSSYDTWLRVFSTDMTTELHSCDDCGPCGTRAVLDAQLDVGDYVLVIEGFSSSHGYYSVDMNCPLNICTSGLSIDNSSTTCTGVTGDTCNYMCNDGYRASGTHVCGSDGAFSGGSCVRFQPLNRLLQTNDGFHFTTKPELRGAILECQAESAEFRCPTSEQTYGPIHTWDVSSITDMSYLFSDCSGFNGDISSWDVSSVTIMYYMFSRASAFNGDLSSWDVSSVRYMQNMFVRTSAFNGDLSSWDVSSATDMASMFQYASAFNGDLSSWDVSSVRSMQNMFMYASVFNGDISSWDVSSVTNVQSMFMYAAAFNGDLSSWDVSSVTTVHSMFCYALAFNGDLSSWDVSSVTNMMQTFYLASAFNGGDLSSWDVSSVTTMHYMFSSASAFNGDLSSWDVSSVRSMYWMFAGATAFNGDLSSWNPSSVTDMRGTFDGASVFNGGDLSSWDVSSVTRMERMFMRSAFNGDVSSWDVSSVTNMMQMFAHVVAFNGDISSWDVSSVTNMAQMFSGASAFNGELSSWDVSSVNNMASMFQYASAFNGGVSSWDVSSVTNMGSMFSSAAAFNGDLSSWDVSSVTGMRYMFTAAGSFEAARCPLTSQPFPSSNDRVCTCFTGSPGVDSCAQDTQCVNAACDDGVAALTPTWRATDACVEATSGNIVCAGTTCTPQGEDICALDGDVCLSSGDTTKLVCLEAATEHQLVGIYADPTTWVAASCSDNDAACTCGSTWTAQCDTSFSARCGMVQDPDAPAPTVFCADIAPPLLVCADTVLRIPCTALAASIIDLVSELDDNSIHFADHLARFKLTVSDPASSELPYVYPMPRHRWLPAAAIIQPQTHIAFGVSPARSDRTITLNVTDRSGNSATCTAQIHVLAPQLTLSAPSIAMTTLTTSSTEIFELELTNTGDLPLTVDSGRIQVFNSNSGSVTWASVYFQQASRVVQVGRDDPVAVVVAPDRSLHVGIQFLGLETPGGGDYNATLRFMTNDPDNPATEISLSFHVDDFALVIVGLPKVIESTNTPGTVSDHTVTVYNVYSAGLTFEHVGCTCTGPQISGVDLSCRLNASAPEVAVGTCNHSLPLGGSIHAALQLVAPTTTGLYEHEWRMRPVVPSGLPQFWDVTVVLAVVSDPSMFDPERTTLIISIPSVTATQVFDILVNVRDRYGNEITTSGIPTFGIALSRRLMQSATSADSQFFVSFDTTLGYIVHGAVAEGNGTHEVRELVGFPTNIRDENSSTISLVEPLTFHVNPVPCNPPATYASSDGNLCLRAFCERGHEVSLDLSTCEQCTYGTFSDDGSGHGRQCEPCEDGSVCGESGCIACTQCSAGQTANTLRTECVACPAASAGNSGICNQCSNGSTPNDGQTICQPCQPGTAGMAGQCSPCSAGTAPSADRSECTACAEFSYSTTGEACVVCEEPSVVDGADETGSGGTSCRRCSPGEAPNVQRRQCVECAAGRFSSFGVQCQVCTAPRVVQESRTQCNACPAGQGPNGDHTDCTSCTGTQFSTIGQCQDCVAPNIVEDSFQTCRACGAGEAP
eukprot:SAG31_NODE_2463_length_5656_cov_12.750765_2_plen_1624_part_01